MFALKDGPGKKEKKEKKEWGKDVVKAPPSFRFR